MHDMRKMNDLPTEVKLLVVKAQTLVDETRSRMKKPGLYLDLTCKMQLKNDCAEAERRIKGLAKSKNLQKDVEKLNQTVLRLKTTSENILHWSYHE